MARARLQPGTVLDGFQIGRQLHTGGMAMLWEVTHPDVSMPLLMKVPLLFEGEDPEAIVGFEMEQMILPRLKGPHVPQFVALGDFSEQPYIVMEQIPGGSLLQRLPGLPLPAPEVAGLGARIATALCDLHRQHVVHNDIKPSNILLRPSGEAVLVDFGLSRHDQLPDLLEEEFHIPIGTAPYMSPEQIRRNRGEPRSDLYSLGALLYFFATGQRPFGDPRGQRAVNRRLWRDPEPPRRRNPGIPPWLQEVVLRCLEVDPALRHPTAAQLAFDLQNPEQIELTARSRKAQRDGFATALRRRLRSNAGRAHRGPGASAQALAAPIIVAAIDLDARADTLAATMRETLARIIATSDDARLACVHVLKTPRLAIETTLDPDGRNKHVTRLVQLRHWAEPLRLGSERTSFHVLESPDPAAALLDYARVNHADHIVMAARSSSTLRRYLGSVSSEVVAHAPCTVTVVRVRQTARDAAALETAPAGGSAAREAQTG